MRHPTEHSFTHSEGIPLRSVIELCAENPYFAVFVTDARHYRCAVGASRSIVLHETADAFAKLEAFHRHATSTIAGYLGYDLKNDLHGLASANADALDMPVAAFFEPELWLEVDENQAKITGADEAAADAFAEKLGARLDALHNRPELFDVENGRTAAAPVTLEPRTQRRAYLEAARQLQAHIQRGDIYEVNYCIHFAGDTDDRMGKAPAFDPVSAFIDLQKRTEAPMSVFARMGPYHVLCASPERFLKSDGGTLLSQPIKGTARRSDDPVTDTILRENLRLDLKERSENVMIVDLVRNDLSRVAQRGSVQVDELFGVYSFKTVHHMISSITARLTDELSPWDAVKACFPPGSMTGAPKISAMKLIEDHENFRRGPYAGGFGWMDAPGSGLTNETSFDFNVMIRTLLFNSDKQLTSLSVGSALTAAADPEKEYEECLLKARALMEVLNPSLSDHGVESTL